MRLQAEPRARAAAGRIAQLRMESPGHGRPPAVGGDGYCREERLAAAGPTGRPQTEPGNASVLEERREHLDPLADLGTRTAGALEQHRIEDAARDAQRGLSGPGDPRQRSAHVPAPQAREPDRIHAGRARAAQIVDHAEALEDAPALDRHELAAQLVTREGLLLGQHHPRSGLRGQGRQRGARRTAARDQDVEAAHARSSAGSAATSRNGQCRTIRGSSTPASRAARASSSSVKPRRTDSGASCWNIASLSATREAIAMNVHGTRWRLRSLITTARLATLRNPRSSATTASWS